MSMTASPMQHRNAERLGLGAPTRLFGVQSGLVTDNVDPNGQGRVKIELPAVDDGAAGRFTTWARLVTPMAGGDRGVWFIPEVGDEVAVIFESGDPNRPFVLGALWNGTDAPPETASADNDIRSIVSRSGIRITMDDKSGSSALTLETPMGQRIELTDAGPSVTIEDSNGNRAVFESAGVTIDAAAKVTVNASTIEMSAGMLTVNAGMSKFSGVVQADTVITNSVVSSSYTPGAGNIW